MNKLKVRKHKMSKKNKSMKKYGNKIEKEI